MCCCTSPGLSAYISKSSSRAYHNRPQRLLAYIYALGIYIYTLQRRGPNSIKRHRGPQTSDIYHAAMNRNGLRSSGGRTRVHTLLCIYICMHIYIPVRARGVGEKEGSEMTAIRHLVVVQPEIPAFSLSRGRWIRINLLSSRRVVCVSHRGAHFFFFSFFFEFFFSWGGSFLLSRFSVFAWESGIPFRCIMPVYS